SASSAWRGRSRTSASIARSPARACRRAKPRTRSPPCWTCGSGAADVRPVFTLKRKDVMMETRISEIADGIYRLSTFVPEIAPPAGFTFNQFLIDADQPLLFHCGPRAMFASISAAVAQVLPPEQMRWIAFGHVESDECGAMNAWLAAAPQAVVAHGAIGCMVSLNDLADRPPRALADGEVIDLGGKRVRHIDTPHVPHAWEARVLYEETTGTLLCGDLFTHIGNGPA